MPFVSASGWLLITRGDSLELSGPHPHPGCRAPGFTIRASQNSTEIGLAAQSLHLLRGGGREDLWSDSGASCGQMGKPRHKEGATGLRSHGTLSDRGLDCKSADTESSALSTTCRGNPCPIQAAPQHGRSSEDEVPDCRPPCSWPPVDTPTLSSTPSG